MKYRFEYRVERLDGNLVTTALRAAGSAEVRERRVEMVFLWHDNVVSTLCVCCCFAPHPDRANLITYVSSHRAPPPPTHTHFSIWDTVGYVYSSAQYVTPSLHTTHHTPHTTRRHHTPPDDQRTVPSPGLVWSDSCQSGCPCPSWREEHCSHVRAHC